MVHKHIWERQITIGSLVKPGSSGRFDISRTEVSPILKCLKNRAVVFVKQNQVWPNTEIDLRLTRLGAMSGSWASRVYTTEMICGCVEKEGFGGHSTQVTWPGMNCDAVHCWRSPDWRFVHVLKRQALAGTARKSLGRESIATQSIAGVVQIEDLSSQWRSQVPKRHLLSPVHSWLNQDQKLVTSRFYKNFEKKYAWVAAVNPLIVDLLWSNWQCQVTGGSCNHMSRQ
jgi:hypothetical protein